MPNTSPYVPASWNTGLYLNSLQQEIIAIGKAIGYYYNLIPVNGAIVTNNNTTVSTNNTNQYAYSSNNYLSSWIAQATPSVNTNMFIGISTNMKQVFPGASSVAMQMINYGIIIDNDGEEFAITFPIVNGVFNNIKSYGTDSLTPVIKMTYSDGTINFYADNSPIISFQQSGLTLENVQLVVGSFANGTLNNISWSGTGGSSAGGSQTLAETLAFGNDANNLSIVNVGGLTVNNNIICETLQADYQVNAVNNLITPLINGNSNNLSLAPDNLHTKVMDLAVFQNNPMVYLYNQGNTKQGRLFDSTFYPSSNSYDFTFTSGSTFGTKKILPQTSTSILTFPVNKGFTSYSMNLPAFSWSFDNGGSTFPVGQKIFKFWITDVLNEDHFPVYGNSFSTQDFVGQAYTAPNNIILEYNNTNSSTLLYLNVYIAYNNGGTYDMNDFSIAGQIIGNISPISNITPFFTP